MTKKGFELAITLMGWEKGKAFGRTFFPPLKYSHGYKEKYSIKILTILNNEAHITLIHTSRNRDNNLSYKKAIQNIIEYDEMMELKND